jgi:hypothetical protein
MDGESVYDRLDHLERLCDTISDQTNWVRARDQIRAVRAWCKQRDQAKSEVNTRETEGS